MAQVLGVSQSRNASGSHVYVDFKDSSALRQVMLRALALTQSHADALVGTR
jgi:hypothetical protein